MKKYILGIALLVLAGFVLFQEALPDLGISSWSLVWIVGVGYFFISSLVNRGVTSSVIFGLWLFILLNNEFSWLKISNRNFFLAGVLILIAVKLIFKPKTISSHFSISKEGFIGKRETAFGSSTRYINDDNFVHDEAEVAFGSASVYFDNAEILGDTASFSVDAVFSSVKLYVPSNWRVDLQTDQAFSVINNPVNNQPTDKVLQVRADMAFSNLEIIYI